MLLLPFSDDIGSGSGGEEHDHSGGTQDHEEHDHSGGAQDHEEHHHSGGAQDSDMTEVRTKYPLRNVRS